MELCAALLRPAAFDCSVLIPPKASNGLTPNPPSQGFESRISLSLNPVIISDLLLSWLGSGAPIAPEMGRDMSYTATSGN